jgi:hypothetical protein
MKMNPGSTTLEDVMLVSFLKLKGHVIKPWLSRDDPRDPRVSFDIQGDEKVIEENIKAFYDNTAVNIQDFCRCLKETKSTMYAMRKIGAGGEK